MGNWSQSQWDSFPNSRQALIYNHQQGHVALTTGGEGQPRNMPYVDAYIAFTKDPTNSALQQKMNSLYGGDFVSAGGSSGGTGGNRGGNDPRTMPARNPAPTTIGRDDWKKLPADQQSQYRTITTSHGVYYTLKSPYLPNSTSDGTGPGGGNRVNPVLPGGTRDQQGNYVSPTSVSGVNSGGTVPGGGGSYLPAQDVTPTQGTQFQFSNWMARMDAYANEIKGIQNSQLKTADKIAKIAETRNNFEMELAKKQEGRSEDLWNRWKTVYEPLETQFVKESQAGTPLDYAAERAGAGVKQKFNELGQEQEAGLLSAGLSSADPTWQRAQRLRDIAGTAAQAGAMNTARDTTRTENWDKKKYAVGLGEPYAGKAVSTTGSAAGMTAGGLSGLSSAEQGYTSAAGTASDRAGLYTSPYSGMIDWYGLLEKGASNVKAAKEGAKDTTLDWLKWATG